MVIFCDVTYEEGDVGKPRSSGMWLREYWNKKTMVSRKQDRKINAAYTPPMEAAGSSETTTPTHISESHETLQFHPATWPPFSRLAPVR